MRERKRTEEEEEEDEKEVGGALSHLKSILSS